MSNITGRPKGSIKPKEQLIKATTAQVDISTKPTVIPNKAETAEVLVKKPFRCCMCGDRFSKQSGNFPATHSPFFNGNGHYLTICNRCFNNSTDQYTEVLGSQDEAIRRMALHWDMYLSEGALKSVKKIDAHRSRIKEYVKQLNLSQNSWKTYDDYLKECGSDVIESLEHLDQLKAEGKVSTSTAAAERWGVGLFSDSAYKALDDHYKMLKRQNPNADNNQEIFIKDLCYIKIQQMQAMKDKKPDDFKTFTQLYRETFKQAGLKTIEEADTSNDEVLGVTLATISQYTPEEYYQDKKLYKDFDGLGDYIKRFMLRPLKNLQFGSHDRDDEFHVKDDADVED